MALLTQTFEEDKFARKEDFSWDYKGVNTKSYTHIFHQYPAMFIPQVARRLILKYSKKGDLITDIFCGSGTALVESMLLGRHSVGIDLNPHAVLLARAKTTPISTSKLQQGYLKIVDAYWRCFSKKLRPPEFFNIDFWFKSEVISELTRIKNAIQTVKDPYLQRFFLVSFSHTVRTSSNTRGGEFKLYRLSNEKLVKYRPNVFKTFKDKTEANIRGMIDFYKDYNRFTKVQVIEGDSTRDNGIPENSVDLILTSPPYGDSKTTVAYGQFSRLSMQWLGMSDEKVKSLDNEMLGGKVSKETLNSLKSNYINGTIEKINVRDRKRSLQVLSFFLDLKKAFSRAYKILKRKGYFCIVVGNRTVKSVRIPTDYIIAEIAEDMGFKTEEIVVRNIPNKRMPKKNSPTNKPGVLEDTMNQESIIILKKN